MIDPDDINDGLWKRFNEKCEPCPATGCWLWTGAILASGYGQLRVGEKGQRAHRVSYELHIGPISGGMHVLHRCDVPSCVNPSHLWLGVPADNSADRNKKGRQAVGESQGSSKLTEAEVQSIRTSDKTHRALARQYGVHYSTIGSIKLGKKWNYLK